MMNKIVRTKDGRIGRVVEIVLFRRSETVGYGIKEKNGKTFYVGSEDLGG
jgi:hypothetical protein